MTSKRWKFIQQTNFYRTHARHQEMPRCWGDTQQPRQMPCLQWGPHTLATCSLGSNLACFCMAHKQRMVLRFLTIRWERNRRKIAHDMKKVYESHISVSVKLRGHRYTRVCILLCFNDRAVRTQEVWPSKAKIVTLTLQKTTLVDEADNTS